jgi:ABC-2 type transport system ATP-binding protein
MVRFKDVRKDYGDVIALNDVSFSVHPGGITGMLGPNGAGKTTAMRIMTGFLAPTAGDVYIDDRRFTPDTVEARRHIGYLPESAPLYNDMLAWDYLVYEARVHGLDPRARVPEVIREVGLESHAHKPIRELSKGFRQRVGLAHALLHDPRLLILDEPTNGLDPNQIIEVRDLIRRIARTKTVILSTHIMQEVQALCDHVLVIHRGRIRYDGPIGEFQTGVATGPQRIRLLVSGIEFPQLREELARIPGFQSLQEIAPAGGPPEATRPTGSTGPTGPIGPTAPIEPTGSTALTAPTSPTAAGDARLLAVRLTVSADENAPDARARVFHAAAGISVETRVGTRAGAGTRVGAGQSTRAGTDTGAPRFVLYEMVREQTSLEDVFHELTRDDAGAVEAETEAPSDSPLTSLPVAGEGQGPPPPESETTTGPRQPTPREASHD